MNEEFSDKVLALREAIRQRVANDPAIKARQAAQEAARAAAWEAAQAEARKPQRVRPKMTATERKQYQELMQLMPTVMMDFHWPELVHSFFPEEWKDIPADPKPGKTRITLRVDADVARFFRKTGRGYQARMSDVLRTFMLARLVEIVGLGREPAYLVMAQDTKQKTALDREAKLVRELEALRRKRTGMG